jgi:hypothetical protein
MKQKLPPPSDLVPVFELMALTAVVAGVLGALRGWNLRRLWRRKIAALQNADRELPP